MYDSKDYYDFRVHGGDRIAPRQRNTLMLVRS